MPNLQLSYAERDRKSIWHPWNIRKISDAYPITIVRGEGVYVYDEDDTPYLDAISSWWVNLHGHCHPYITRKIVQQLGMLEHVMFNDFTHPPAVEFADKLLKNMPAEMTRVFFSDNGATAVEAALKIALQFWFNQQSATRKKVIISFKGGFHGETFGTMSTAGKNLFNRPFWSHLFHVETIIPPLKGSENESLIQLKETLASGDVAAFIFEPLVMGVGGMNCYSAEILDHMIEMCQKEHVITIADEVMTGFGRLGPLFASSLLANQPDIICLSKGITGGFLPLGATVCKEFLYKAFHTGNADEAFLHGHSYTGNPLACTAALASLELLLKEECQQSRNSIALAHQAFCEKWKGHIKLKRCESVGTLLILEYRSKERSYFNSIGQVLHRHFINHHVLLRPLGNVLYVMPPYCITQEQLAWIYGLIEETFTSCV